MIVIFSPVCVRKPGPLNRFVQPMRILQVPPRRVEPSAVAVPSAEAAEGWIAVAACPDIVVRIPFVGCRVAAVVVDRAAAWDNPALAGYRIVEADILVRTTAGTWADSAASWAAWRQGLESRRHPLSSLAYQRHIGVHPPLAGQSSYPHKMRLDIPGGSTVSHP